jgi:hypothetical protein
MLKPPRVTLIKQVKVHGKWRPATVLFDRKGRVRPDRVRVNGQDEAPIPKAAISSSGGIRGSAAAKRRGPTPRTPPTRPESGRPS